MELQLKEKIVRPMGLFWLCAALLFGCSRADAQDAKPKSAASAVENILVTFVELGSVRCIPCKLMQPVMKDIEKDYAGQVKVVFHDVWTPAGEPFGQTYKIRVIPTQVFLDKEGKEYFRHEGFFPKEELVKILKQKGVK
jgi:thioredoxin 1